MVQELRETCVSLCLRRKTRLGSCAIKNDQFSTTFHTFSAQHSPRLRATLGAFVAILESSRNLVAWGIPERGGAPRNEVQELKDVQEHWNRWAAGSGSVLHDVERNAPDQRSKVVHIRIRSTQGAIITLELPGSRFYTVFLN